MADPRTAEIIHFPMQRMEQAGRERLSRSLVRLQAVLAEQATAVADWRAQLARLHASVDALGRSFDDYGARLNTTKRGVEAVNAEARRLESWADSVVPSCPRSSRASTSCLCGQSREWPEQV